MVIENNMAGTERKSGHGIWGLKIISSASTSRMFRSFLLLMSIFLVLLFVYLNTGASRLSGAIHDNIPMRIHSYQRKLISNDHSRIGAFDQGNRRMRQGKKTGHVASEHRTSNLSGLKHRPLEPKMENIHLGYTYDENGRLREAITVDEYVDEKSPKDGFVAKNDQFEDRSDGGVKGKSEQPIFIVILARMRTGSTLIGEIFNQNPSLFFIFEPLISIDPLLRSGYVNVSQHKNISTQLLLNYTRCEFQENLTQSWLKWNGGSVRSNKIVPLCKRPSRPQSSYRNCTLVTVDDMRNICSHSHRRFCIKTIRADLDYFKPLIDAGVNVKIIHLVRDPRGTANSRRLYYNFSKPHLPRTTTTGHLRFKGKLDSLGLLGDYPDHVVHTIPRLCQWTRDSIHQVQNEKPSWLRNRYKLVRYEDFALDPLRAAHQIYDFVGLEFPPAVIEWIVTNTRSNDQRSVKLFSTHKNSIETAYRWRQSLRPLQVRQVEQICHTTMKLLGYKEAKSVWDIANMDVNLLDPLPIPDTF
nr:carbohydrate sulfotransferase 3-like [Lytechinus pictus]